MVCHASVLPGWWHSRCGDPEMASPRGCSQCRIDAVSELGIVFVSSMYRSLITIQYPKCIQRVSKWYRKTIQYRSPDGAKNVSCSYRASIEQKVSRYCIESRIDEITIHVRYTTIHYDTLRYIYGENPPRYMGKKAPSPHVPRYPSTSKRMNGERRGRATQTPQCHFAPMNEARHARRANWTTLAAPT